MSDSLDTTEIQKSLKNDDLLCRLEKLSIFLEDLVFQITEDEIPEKDVSKIVEHIKIQKKIYEHAHMLYDTIKDENMEQEKALEELRVLSETIEEYKNFKKTF